MEPFYRHSLAPENPVPLCKETYLQSQVLLDQRDTEGILQNYIIRIYFCFYIPLSHLDIDMHNEKRPRQYLQKIPTNLSSVLNFCNGPDFSPNALEVLELLKNLRLVVF